MTAPSSLGFFASFRSPGHRKNNNLILVASSNPGHYGDFANFENDFKSRFQKLAKSPYFPCLKKKKILLKIVADVKESTTTGFTAGEVHLGI